MMLRRLFNELWLNSGSCTVLYRGVRRNYSHEGRCLKIRFPGNQPLQKRTCKTLSLGFETLLEKKQVRLSQETRTLTAHL